jgi:hypothetical protein
MIMIKHIGNRFFVTDVATAGLRGARVTNTPALAIQPVASIKAKATAADEGNAYRTVSLLGAIQSPASRRVDHSTPCPFRFVSYFAKAGPHRAVAW